jgi:hypothetical protein
VHTFEIVTTDGRELGPRELGRPDWPIGSVICRGCPTPNLRVVAARIGWRRDDRGRRGAVGEGQQGSGRKPPSSEPSPSLTRRPRRGMGSASGGLLRPGPGRRPGCSATAWPGRVPERGVQASPWWGIRTLGVSKLAASAGRAVTDHRRHAGRAGILDLRLGAQVSAVRTPTSRPLVTHRSTLSARHDARAYPRPPDRGQPPGTRD